MMFNLKCILGVLTTPMGILKSWIYLGSELQTGRQTHRDSESLLYFDVEFSGLWADSDVNTDHIDQDGAQLSPQRLGSSTHHTLCIKQKTRANWFIWR